MTLPETLLSPAELGVSAERLRTAEALIAGAIGARSLAERQVTQTGTFQGGFIPLKDGPATAITSFVLNGYPAAPSFGPWWLDMGWGTRLLTPTMGGWTAGLYAVTYTAGWTKAALPEPVTAAVLLTAQQLEATAAAEGLKEYRVGEVTRVYNVSASPTAVPAAALALLAPYQPLRF